MSARAALLKVMNSKPSTGRRSTEMVAADLGRRASGAAGVHADQKARKSAAAGKINRVGSRKAARRAAIEDQR